MTYLGLQSTGPRKPSSTSLPTHQSKSFHLNWRYEGLTCTDERESLNKQESVHNCLDFYSEVPIWPLPHHVLFEWYFAVPPGKLTGGVKQKCGLHLRLSFTVQGSSLPATQRSYSGITLLILKVGANGSRWWKPCPDRFTKAKGTKYPLYRRPGGTQGLNGKSVEKRKNLGLVGIQTRWDQSR